jgi:hypothetical protein
MQDGRHFVLSTAQRGQTSDDDNKKQQSVRNDAKNELTLNLNNGHAMNPGLHDSSDQEHHS